MKEGEIKLTFAHLQFFLASVFCFSVGVIFPLKLHVCVLSFLTCDVILAHCLRCVCAAKVLTLCVSRTVVLSRPSRGLETELLFLANQEPAHSGILNFLPDCCQGSKGESDATLMMSQLAKDK